MQKTNETIKTKKFTTEQQTNLPNHHFDNDDDHAHTRSWPANTKKKKTEISATRKMTKVATSKVLVLGL